MLQQFFGQFWSLSKHQADSLSIFYISSKEENLTEGDCSQSNFVPTLFSTTIEHSLGFFNTFHSDFYGWSSWLIVAVYCSCTIHSIMLRSLAKASHGIPYASCMWMSSMPLFATASLFGRRALNWICFVRCIILWLRLARIWNRIHEFDIRLTAG